MAESKQLTLFPEISDSIEVLSDKIVVSTKNILLTAKSEDDLKIRFEGFLNPILESIGITTIPAYEHRAGHKSIFRGPSDAMHGQVIIEYESPDRFSSNHWVDHAHEQLVNYMIGESSQEGSISFYSLKRLVGVGFDGLKIFFVQYCGVNDNGEIDKSYFKRTNVFPFDKETARTFLFYLRALSRKSINAQNLTEKFGPNGDIARAMVSGLVDALENWKKQKVCIFYKEWKRLFGIVYGEHLTSTAHENVEELCNLYGLTTEIDFQELLFCVHTYFAILMKLIASELVTLKESRLASSFSQNLVHTSSKKELVDILTQIEDGDVFKSKGIINFLEGDFFRWYLDAVSPRLEDAIREMARTISEFEPATSTIDPEPTRDLLKKLYQYLVPQDVRQKLGEYYTPDWLAELILDEVGYNGENTRKRLLDPSCGSGTFVVLAIQRSRKYGLESNENRHETTQRILRNIWGFDLNPLAVIASRTNYLFALGDSINDFEEVEIPIYLADSVLWPQRTMGQVYLDIEEGNHVKIQTSVELFHVPCLWIRGGGVLIKKVSPEIERMVKLRYPAPEVIERLRHENLIDPSQEIVAERFYSELLSLELQDKDGIWTRFIKNAITPMMAGKFDLVVGNPPWIRWGYLSQEYRQATLQMWKDYGLFSLRGQLARLGGGEKDFSMLFL